ncbi:LacI family DNA-binding transcriptional regulator [Jiangella anatolica]|uniref:LacI family DNA-binding transcriptional regulator n=1 Tax=Jiangella anatolica TaxID=2670374 RepID=UPI0018F2B02C|nr:LacI family DNA-binding transcriptional regulator [Jiangella anatolica]
MESTRPDPPTLQTVAAAAGVSRSTASRAINGEPRVSPETVEAVQRAVRELGYSPNPAARTLVTRRTGSVALVVPETGDVLFSDPYFATVLSGITAGLAPSGNQLILLIGQHPGDGNQMISYLRGGHVDGAMIISHHRADLDADALGKIPVPVVLGGRPVGATLPGMPYVDADNAGGGRLAAHHLAGTGRTRLGTITGPLDMPAGIDRLDGWRAGMREHNLADDATAGGDFTAASGATAMARLLDEHPDLQGVFVASDLMATGALQELSGRGIRVPDDIAVVGFDDLMFASTATPPLTTIRQPTREAGRLIAETLLAMLDGRTPEPAQILPTELVRRASA